MVMEIFPIFKDPRRARNDLSRLRQLYAGINAVRLVQSLYTQDEALINFDLRKEYYCT